MRGFLRPFSGGQFIEAFDDALVTFLPGDVLIEPKNFSAPDVQDPAGGSNQLKANRFEGLKFEDIGSFRSSGALFCNLCIYLKVPDKIIGKNRDLLMR